MFFNGGFGGAGFGGARFGSTASSQLTLFSLTGPGLGPYLLSDAAQQSKHSHGCPEQPSVMHPSLASKLKPASCAGVRCSMRTLGQAGVSAGGRARSSRPTRRRSCCTSCPSCSCCSSPSCRCPARRRALPLCKHHARDRKTPATMQWQIKACASMVVPKDIWVSGSLS